MASTTQVEGAMPLARRQLESGPFVLRTLLEDVPLSTDGGDGEVKINCVDYLDGNLYVGTSAAELLHFVSIPPDPSDRTGSSTFIFASRLRPFFYPSPAATTPANGGDAAPLPGVQQILLLSRVGKACVLCNSTVTFYSLPELTPVFVSSNPVRNCNWIGGIDLNDAPATNGRVSILLSLRRAIQPVNIGDDALGRRKIDFAGSRLSVRRDSIACVADSHTYTLVDVDRQLKIPLMNISSLDNPQSPGAMGQVQSIAPTSTPDGALSRSASSAAPRTTPHSSALEGPAHTAHTRSTSLGDFIAGGISAGNIGNAAALNKGADVAGRSKSPGPQESGGPDGTPKPPAAATDKPLPPIQPEAGVGAAAPPPVPIVTKPAPPLLKPLIVSPTPEEFLLVTGTWPHEPGIGMFVNLDGDPTRPTLEFERYPHEIVVDGGSYVDMAASTPPPDDGAGEEGYVLASMEKEFPDGLRQGLEIQRWDVNVGEDEPTKFWLDVRRTPATNDRPHSKGQDGSTADKAAPPSPPPPPPPPASSPPGIRSLVGSEESVVAEVVGRLCQRRFSPFINMHHQPGAAMSLRSVDSRTALSMEHMSKERDLFERDLNAPDDDEEEPLPEGWEAARVAEEEDGAARLARTTARLAVWSGQHIWWAVRNPLVLQLEAALEANGLDDWNTAATTTHPTAAKDRRQLFAVLNSFRGRDPRTELEFRTFSYVRQRAGVLIFSSFLHPSEAPFSEPELKALEEVLLEGGLDPRVVLALIPGLRHEIIEGRKGIWIFGGVKGTVERYLSSDRFAQAGKTISALDPRILHFLRRFLTACRRRKGFGSVPDESEVSRTVDASLLAVLLELDRGSPPGPGPKGSVRAEINELVDRGVDCFERAVDLLEAYNRLYVLSRLYQSRRMAGDVLATWRRIVEGEEDEGGELQDGGGGEQRVRDYLSNVSNPALVREYGVWLAARNPRLGVQVFADDRGRAPRPHPAEVVVLLREEAPGAVKHYLEHLVFDRGHTTHVGELVGHYLDVVMTDLESSAEARENVAAMYESYRALRPPKPTFRRFLTDNAPPGDEVWHSRLRLLQLLGGPHDYDVAAVRERISRHRNGHVRVREGEDAEEDGEDGENSEELLVPEAIILDGREGRHKHALRLLVHRLGDYDTAVLYCLRRRPSPSPQPEQQQKEQQKQTQKQKQNQQQDVVVHHNKPKQQQAEAPPEARDIQQTQTLFRALLGEFLALEDVSDRVEQTGQLLERFGGWFDVLEVLSLIPDGWAVDPSLAGFLTSSLRRLVRERHEAMVARALGSAENLRVNCELLDRIGKIGPSVEVEN